MWTIPLGPHGSFLSTPAQKNGFSEYNVVYSPSAVVDLDWLLLTLLQADSPVRYVRGITLATAHVLGFAQQEPYMRISSMVALDHYGVRLSI